MRPMKESGLYWIGHIPQSWDVFLCQNVCVFRQKQTLDFLGGELCYTAEYKQLTFAYICNNNQVFYEF